MDKKQNEIVCELAVVVTDSSSSVNVGNNADSDNGVLKTIPGFLSPHSSLRS